MPATSDINRPRAPSVAASVPRAPARIAKHCGSCTNKTADPATCASPSPGRSSPGVRREFLRILVADDPRASALGLERPLRPPRAHVVAPGKLGLVVDDSPWTWTSSGGAPDSAVATNDVLRPGSPGHSTWTDNAGGGTGARTPSVGIVADVALVALDCTGSLIHLSVGPRGALSPYWSSLG